MKRSILAVLLLSLATAHAVTLKEISATCSAPTVVSGATLTCTSTLNAAAPAKAQLFVYGISGPITLASTNYFAGTTATFTIKAGTVTKATPASFVVNAYSVSITVKITVEPAGVTTPTYLLTASPASIAFGNITVGQKTSLPLTLTNTGTGTVTISATTISSGFTVSGGVTSLAPGTSTVLTAGWGPGGAGAVSGTLTITSNATGSPLTIPVSGTGVGIVPPPTVTVKSLTSASGSVTGPASVPMTVTVSAAPASATAVTLASSSPAVTVPASVSVPAGTVSAGFTASALAVTAATPVNLTASLNSSTASFALTDSPPAPPPVAYQVNLTWAAPVSSSVVGYIVMRATGSGTFQLLTSAVSPITALAYTDTTVADGVSYSYEVLSVGSNGAESGPSNVYTAVIP